MAGAGDNVIQTKSFAFAVRCTKLGKVLRERSEFILSKQLVRSGTSIGANIEEALGGFSRKEFAYKLQIAYKEARETDYWIRILSAAGHFSLEETQSLREELSEILAILTSILNTVKSKAES
jgi:four helix bundle protein